MDVDMYERVLSRTEDVVARVGPYQLAGATGCADWDVRTLLNHIVGGCAAFAAGAHGEPVDLDAEHLGDDHVAAYRKAAADAVAAFREPGALDRTFTMPWGEMPGRAALGTALAEAAVHGWDLARAAGQPSSLDGDVAEAVHAMTTSMMQPLGRYPRGGAFADPVEVPDDAPVTDRMLAYLGRRP